MFGLGAVPARSNPKLRRPQKSVQVTKDQVFDLAFIKRFTGITILVRVTNGQFSLSVLTDHDMNPQGIVLRQFSGDPLFESWQTLTVLERRIPPQSEPACQHGSEPPGLFERL